MKTERVEYRFGEFTDYANNKRKYIVCAISKVLCVSDKKDDGMAVMSDSDLLEFYNSDLTIHEDSIIGVKSTNIVNKSLSLGFAICNAGDSFDENIGKQIAYGKASKKPNRVLYANHLGLINTKVVNAVIEQEMTYFESNPGVIITGYDDKKKKYLNESK